MQVKFEFVSYDDMSDTFELDENIYTYDLDEDQVQTYELLKSVDLHLYNWFKESEFFKNWIKTEVYPDQIGKKIAICDINDITFRRYFFFKVTSADSHYEYFKKQFDILHELDWQDREEVGEQILEKLKTKKQELIFELEKDIEDQDEDKLDESKPEVTE
ncbi:hypothetical protein N9X61_00240 [Sulfurimonas sp.]|nr:hypothetical protein [Sulfurimonas sp.]